MKKIFFILLIVCVSFSVSTVTAQIDANAISSQVETNVLMEKVIEDGETIYLKTLRPVYVYPPLVFKNKRQERFYWRTVRDVKKALPYARLASMEINNLNKELFLLPNDAARKRHISQFQKRIFDQYEKPLRNLTINQGKMLVKLIDREHDMNTFELIKAYKGSMPAVFWNTIARFFGSNLKTEYDATDKDRIVERVVTLVDAGQL